MNIYHCALNANRHPHTLNLIIFMLKAHVPKFNWQTTEYILDSFEKRKHRLLLKCNKLHDS